MNIPEGPREFCPICEEYHLSEGEDSVCDSLPTLPDPQLEWAVRVLNRERHRGTEQWVARSGTYGSWVEIADGGAYLTSFEAVAIARELERQEAKELPLEWKLCDTDYKGCPAWEADLVIDDVLSFGALVVREASGWKLSFTVTARNHAEVCKPARWNYDMPDLPDVFETAELAREAANRRFSLLRRALGVEG